MAHLGRTQSLDKPQENDLFNTLLQNIQKTENEAKKLLKDIKSIMDAVMGLHKCESKMVSNLNKSPLCAAGRSSDGPLRNTVHLWSASLVDLDKDCKKLTSDCSSTCVDPLKDYLHLVSGHYGALRKRENALQTLMLIEASTNLSAALPNVPLSVWFIEAVCEEQKFLEHARASARWKKLEKDGKYSVTTAKLSELRNNLTETELILDALNAAVTKDLIVLSTRSLEFFQPLLTLLTQAQRKHYKVTYGTLNALSITTYRQGPVTEQSLQDEMTILRNQLETLSIVDKP